MLEDDLCRINQVLAVSVGPEVASRCAQFIARLSQKTEVIGICGLGGIAGLSVSHPLDEFSDIDFAVFLRPGPTPTWLPEFAFKLHIGRGRLGPTINLYQNFLTDLDPKKQQNLEKAEAFESAAIYWDPEGAVSARVDILLRSLDRKAMLCNFIHRSSRFIRDNQLKLSHRDSLYAAHLLLNRAAEYLLHALYLLNGMLPSHLKWADWHLQRFKSLPPNALEQFATLLQINSMSWEEYARRQVAGEELLAAVTRIGIDTGMLPSNYYDVVCRTYHCDRQKSNGTFVSQVLDRLQESGNQVRDLVTGFVCTELVGSWDELAVLTLSPNFADVRGILRW